MESKTLIDVLPDTLREEKKKTQDETLGDIDAKILVEVLTNTLTLEG